MSERLDIVDENGVPTGETVDREVAHRDGIRHRTSHVWIVRLGPDDRMQVLVQKRAAGKDAFPGCWDISSAGHIPAGDDWVASALRELREELGVEAKPEDLKWLGNRRVEHDGIFHGKPFRNRQVSAVFALHLDRPAGEFAIQESEIESVEWTDLDDCIEAVRRNALPNCISLQELRWIKRKVWLYPPGEGPFVSASHGAYKWLSIFPLAWWRIFRYGLLPLRGGKRRNRIATANQCFWWFRFFSYPSYSLSGGAGNRASTAPNRALGPGRGRPCSSFWGCSCSTP